jgi:hypothetical protein
MYMVFWSFVVIVTVGITRLRDVRQTAVVVAITLLVLMISQSLAAQLATSVGLEPNMIFVSPEAFLLSGPVGWLALLVTPCGWLGPLIGFNLVQRQRQMMLYEA